MRTKLLNQTAALVLIAAAPFALTRCGQEDLTTAVADDVSGESMGVPTAIDTAPGAASTEAPAPAPTDALDGAAVAESGGEALGQASDDAAPPSSAGETPLLSLSGSPRAGAVDTPTDEAERPDESTPAAESPATGVPALPALDEPDKDEPVEDEPVVDGPPMDGPIGDLATAKERAELPPVDEPEAPPAESTADAASSDVAEDTPKEATDDEVIEPGSWQPPPVEEPKLVDGIWNVTFDYLGSFDTGKLALPEDSPMAIEARREQRLLAEKESTTPSGLPPEADDIPVTPPVEIGFPDAVRKMDGQKVQIEGYMIPLKFDDGKVKSFFLSRYMMGCCFGVLPKANEIIEVEMVEGKGAFYDAYMPFVVTGKFVIVEDGTDPDFMQSVFRMTAESCDFSEDW